MESKFLLFPPLCGHDILTSKLNLAVKNASISNFIKLIKVSLSEF